MKTGGKSFDFPPEGVMNIQNSIKLFSSELYVLHDYVALM